MDWISSQLAHSRAVAAAVITTDGGLVEANDGFRRLLGLGAAGDTVAVGSCFVQPTFDRLLELPADPEGQCHAGMVTLGAHAGRTWTLQGRVWRRGDRLYLLAEHDVEELHHRNEVMLELNRESADAQHALAQTSATLRQREDEIRRLSLTDGLTAVGNRRALEEALETGLARAAGENGAFSVLAADPDGCKQVNERYGYRIGDVVLVAFGTLLRQKSRDTDFVARFGGKEFVVLLPGIDLAAARDIAERMRAAWEEVDIEPIREPLRASFGVAQHQNGESADALLRRVEEALRAAKSTGRNRVVEAATESARGGR